MKTALWLYMFLFLAFFDLHAQYPVLTPFAISLGAAPTFIGWMMGIYALTHLPGNLLAGNLIDRHGSRRYIIFSLTAAGVILLLQAHVQLPWQLLVLRSISGFVLAFCHRPVWHCLRHSPGILLRKANICPVMA